MARHITYFTAVFLSLVLFACGAPKKDQEKEPPVVITSEIYDEEKFAEILFDLTMVEAAYRLNMANEESVKKKNEVYREVLLAHATDSTVFDENWTYYGYRPERMQEVYDLVLKKIDEKRVERGAAPTKNMTENE